MSLHWWKTSTVRLLLLFLLPAWLTAQPYGFLTWNTTNGLPQSQVTALAQDSYGYLWVATRGGGVARFDGATFRTYTDADGLPGNFIEQLWADDHEPVFVASDNKTVRYDLLRDRFVSVDSPDGNHPPSAFRSAGFSASVPSPTTAVDLPNGRQLVGSRNQGLYLLDRDGELLEHYTETNSALPHNAVRALLLDRQGRIWIGTSGGGLTRMLPTGLRHFDRADGLADNRVYALHEGRDRLWLGGRRGLQLYDSTGFRRPDAEDLTRGAKITSIAAAGPFTLLGTDGRGVVVLDDSSRSERLTVGAGLPSDWIMTTVGGRNPDRPEAWAFTYADGVSHLAYRDSNWVVTNYQVEEGQEVLRPRSVLRDGDGNFLIGTASGRILRWVWREGQTTIDPAVIGPANGLPGGPVRALALRRGTQLWAAVTGHGLYYTDLRMPPPLRFFPLPLRLRRPAHLNVFQLTAPPDRPEVWLGTAEGVERLTLNTDGQPDVLRRYGRADGFVGGETTGASLIDSSGTIWFGTMNGLARYEPTPAAAYPEPPAAFLAGVDLFYEPLTDGRFSLNGLVDAPDFKATENHFNFRYRAVDLAHPERVRYRYSMELSDERNWSPLTVETAVRYAGLPPGYHRFAVQATTDGGKTFGEEAVFELTIDAPLWGKAWFLGLLALLGSGLLVGGFYTFYRRGQQREARERRRLEARNRLLELEQKALRLQMNPHFIFNALNGIRGLVDGRHDAEAREQIGRFATLLRGILNNSRQEHITLAEEVRVLDDYLRMEQFCQPFTFTYAIEVPEEADPEEVSLPPMLLQPFVENAVLHGLAGRNDGGHVSVTFSVRGRRMQCSVEDNGIGREAAAARKQARAPGHQSVAMDVTRDRLRAIGGRLEITDRPEGGTRVEITVPVETW